MPQTPTRPLVTTTTQPQARWTWRTVVTASATSAAPLATGSDQALLAALLREGGDLVELVVGKPGQTAEVAREAEEALVVLAPLPTEAEQLVDRALELEGLLAALLVVDGEAPQPVGAHLHVGDLIGQHPVLAQRHDRVAAFHAELAHGVEHVDGQPLEGPVDAGQAQERVVGATRLEQEHRLGVLADARAHVLHQLEGDLAMAGLVPRLAGHVKAELVGGARVITEVPCRPSGAFQSLDLPHEDAVHEAGGPLGPVLAFGVHAALRHERRVARVAEALLVGDPREALVAGELVGRHEVLHRVIPLDVTLESL